MSSVTIREWKDGDEAITSVTNETPEKFEALRKAFNRFSTDTLAGRFDISASFINEDGSFNFIGRTTLLNKVDLISKVSALKSLRTTDATQQLDDQINTNIGDSLGGVSVDRARELQQQQLKQQQQQAAERRTNQTPKLQELDRNGNVILEFEPEVVTNHGGSVPFDTESTQLLGGETVVDNRGDHNLRLNLEAVATFKQMNKLFDMRKSGNPLRVVWAGQHVPATFDQINYDRIPDANGFVSPNESIDDALYTVQLQSKEQDEDDDTLFQPFTED